MSSGGLSDCMTLDGFWENWDLIVRIMDKDLNNCTIGTLLCSRKECVTVVTLQRWWPALEVEKMAIH